jgi:hypothetical protein
MQPDSSWSGNGRYYEALGQVATPKQLKEIEKSRGIVEYDSGCKRIAERAHEYRREKADKDRSHSINSTIRDMIV